MRQAYGDGRLGVASSRGAVSIEVSAVEEEDVWVLESTQTAVSWFFNVSASSFPTTRPSSKPSLQDLCPSISHPASIPAEYPSRRAVFSKLQTSSAV